MMNGSYNHHTYECALYTHTKLLIPLFYCCDTNPVPLCWRPIIAGGNGIVGGWIESVVAVVVALLHMAQLLISFFHFSVHPQAPQSTSHNPDSQS